MSFGRLLLGIVQLGSPRGFTWNFVFPLIARSRWGLLLHPQLHHRCTCTDDVNLTTDQFVFTMESNQSMGGKWSKIESLNDLFHFLHPLSHCHDDVSIWGYIHQWRVTISQHSDDNQDTLFCAIFIASYWGRGTHICISELGHRWLRK